MPTDIKKIILKNIFLIFICMGLFAFQNASAATLNLAPSSGTYEVNEAFSVVINVNSGNTAVNAISGTVSYPSDVLQVLSLSKSGSKINFWVTEPSFSSASGKINFEGIVLNPGYTGSAGKILTITFKGKKSALATLSFQASSVLANDGAGTNVLTSTSKANYNIVPAIPQEEVPVKPVPEIIPEPAEIETPIPSDVTLVPKEELESPVITEYPQFVRNGEYLVIRGVTYPNMRVIVSLKERAKSPRSLGHYVYVSNDYSENVQKTIVKSDSNGEFTYASKTPLASGSYDVWAEAYGDNGDKSNPTERLEITVYNTLFLRFGSTLVEVLIIVVPLVALIILLGIILYHAYKRFRRLHRRISEGSVRSRNLVDQSFNILKEDVSLMEQIPRIRGSSQEQLLLAQHKRDLETARDLIEKHLRQMGGDVNSRR